MNPAARNPQASRRCMRCACRGTAGAGDHRQPLPPTGMIFCGSHLIQLPATPGQPVYAADISDSKSIASTYNPEPSTVLDFPRQRPQSQVYTTIKHQANPAYRFAAGQMVHRVQIEPERREGSRRVRDLELFVRVRFHPL